jgi:hypothetical protein
VPDDPVSETIAGVVGAHSSQLGDTSGSAGVSAPSSSETEESDDDSEDERARKLLILQDQVRIH